MNVGSVERFGADELLAGLRDVRLRGFPDVAPYAEAELSIESVDPETLAPPQRYVLRDGVRTMHDLRAALAPHGLDPLALSGGGAYVTIDGDRIPVIPPIVEESHEPDGRTVDVVADGLHRVYAARALGLPITVIVARGLPREHPYYALALPDGWAGVAELDELPDGFQKKTYRNPDNYKSLFRQYNAVFPGVQQQRKRSNPDHLKA
ncbi:MAG TPA: hypothetical protein VFG42_20960 [Baekduia sp.]|uniref:hypothetical protein n=1 Tax=Baekduia sp. TaxID=2600305 RepID=UPI002D779EF6|nr:hypothetical protein [Baekduia sp.]HET6509280.1 hypothetical protein [Baekduia sp.]